MDSVPELLSFAAHVFEKHGGMAEQNDNHVMALLPPGLARSLDLPEEVQLGGGAMPLLYGSPVLDRLIQVATEEIPLVFGRIEVPYLKKAGFDQLIGQDIVFINGQARVTSRAEARASYMVLTCRYVALSDERKEGLVEVGMCESTGAIIEDLETLYPKFSSEIYTPGKIPPHFPIHLEKTIANAMQKAKVLAEEKLTDFINSMRRRLRRDVKNTREYYEALKKEMEASLTRHNLSETQRQERNAKIEDLPREMAQKIEDLQQKYKIQVSLKPCAALRFLVDVVYVMVEIRFRKYTRAIHLTWNPLSRRFDPLVCEQCHKTIRSVHPSIKNSQIRLFCHSCA
ncbi:MAG: hypothetical protein JRF43_03435 [Deltaproteobacteria bacterium]|nr:hypothetical protein [Deltaproteobacteria bacterium]